MAKSQRYRVHLIMTARGFARPVSFRTETYQYDPDGARQAAEWWLRDQPGLEDVQVLPGGSVELVPERP